MIVVGSKTKENMRYSFSHTTRKSEDFVVLDSLPSFILQGTESSTEILVQFLEFRH